MSQQTQTIVAEYVWVDGSGVGTRSKTRTLHMPHVSALEQFGEWNYDGSSCGQASTEESEVTLLPVAYYRDPLRSDIRAYIVICETRNAHSGEPTERGSARHIANRIFAHEAVAQQECWFGLEQEYVVYNGDTQRPLGWPAHYAAVPAPQGPYYCAPSAAGRPIAEEHYRACLQAGLQISGYNMEVMPGQLEFQIGPCVGIDAGDQLVAARYLLERVCERHNCYVSLHPKPVRGDWNGSGMHTNFSTKAMRCAKDTDASWKALQDAVHALEKTHEAHMAVYGSGNEERMSGRHETSSMHKFTYGIGDRSASVRIGKQVEKQRYGYIEDRRPASNADPYLVTAKIAESVLLHEKLL